MTNLKTITESLRAAVDAGDLGAIANGVEALYRLTPGQQTNESPADATLTQDGYLDKGELVATCSTEALEQRAAAIERRLDACGTGPP